MKIIVVGGVAGGATTASQIRRLQPLADITVYEKDRDMSFANCGLPYYIGDIVQDRDMLVQATPESFKINKNITVKTRHEVIKIDTNAKSVEVLNHDTNETITEKYDVLVLSPGCRSLKLSQIEDTDYTFYLRNLEETDTIEAYIQKNKPKNALVIGAGYISLEMIENLKTRGLDVTLLHRSEELFKAMDRRYNQLLKNVLCEHDVELKLNDEVASHHQHKVTFKSGDVCDYDIIVVAVGIIPNTEFLRSTNIELNDKGYIVTDDRMMTNVQDVYAVGDAIETFYRHTGDRTSVALAWGAHRGANIIAQQLAGNDIRFKGLLGTNVVRIFDHTIAGAGLSEAQLKDFDCEHYVVEQKSHAGYMPDARNISISYYVDKKTRKLLRACSFGQQGVDKRIDIIATAMGESLPIEAFVDIEIAYAPPYSSPKDIINMMGYKAIENSNI